MAVPGSYSLKWHGHSGHLNSSISMLYSCNAFADVMLATSDSRYFSAHQFVLSAYSSYFHNMFTIGGNSSKTNTKLVIVLPPEIGHATLSIILQYIYKGEAIVNHEQLPDIMKAAEILQIRGLCKDKRDLRTGGSNILNQHSKSGFECNTSPETVTIPNHRAIIPAVRYNSNPASVNSCCTSPSSTSTASRQTSPILLSPDRKKYRNNKNNSLKDCKKKDNKSIVDDCIIEKMIVGEEIQVKDEPIEWEDQKGMESNAVVKEGLEYEEDVDVTDENSYVPLTCDICQETFTSPALWARHVETKHSTTSLAGSKRVQVEDGSKEYPPLHCEICQKEFLVPAEWVRHIQSHTEQQTSQHSPEMRTESPSQPSRSRFKCNVCGKILQSYTSMQIHIRTHTGERHFLCKVCSREFNVKSNYVRHMRTVHDQIENQSSSQ